MSFRREKFVPKGGPDGGDGGRGRDVILHADQHVDNLTGLFFEPIVKAKNGGHGMGKKMDGRSATAKIVKVPVGAIVLVGLGTLVVAVIAALWPGRKAATTPPGLVLRSE